MLKSKNEDDTLSFSSYHFDIGVSRVRCSDFRWSRNNNLIIRNTAPPIVLVNWRVELSVKLLFTFSLYREPTISYIEVAQLFRRGKWEESWPRSDWTHITYMRYSFMEFDGSHFGNIKHLPSNANVSLMPHSCSSYLTHILYYYTFYVILWIFISTKNVSDTFPSSICCCGKLMNVHKFNCIHCRLMWLRQNRIYIYAHSFAISSACTI